MLSDGDVSSDGEVEDDEVDASSDDGVFDVEDETSVSDNQQILPHPIPARHSVSPRFTSESDDAESESNASSSGDEQVSFIIFLPFFTVLKTYNGMLL